MEQPTGTVTFLFTDVEQSTQLLRELGADRYRVALDDHRRLLRTSFAENGGHEVDTQGDAFFVAFSSARDAVRAAHEAQRLLREHAWDDREVRVRMGIHSCEATATGEGYVGLGVHRGARICAAGHGGQVLLSQATHDLLEEEIEQRSIDIVDLGEHRLKDLSQPQHLFQLAIPDAGLRDFPPLRTLDGRRTNLPVAAPLLGRDNEIGEIASLLRRDDVRVVTLTGPGGVGKTRLSLQVAAELVDEFADGVFFVALAAIADPSLVIQAVGEALGVNAAAGQSLDAYLGSKSLLIVVDNVEQVVEAGPDLGHLVMEAPGLKILATGREPLRLSNERLVAVPPLGVADAVALFRERAQFVDASFGLNEVNGAQVRQICERLDCLPLAVELAAARASLLTPDALLSRLEARLDVLSRGPRDVPERQQTLRNTIAWSYELLDEQEQRLFASLASFSGGFTVDHAEQVCDADLDVLASLVSKSLLRRDDERFGMLETIREFALEQLAASGEGPDLRRRHAAYFLALAEAGYADRLEDEARWADRLASEHDNLRTALDLFEAEDPARAAQLAGALGWFWRYGGHLNEGRERLTRVLEAGVDEAAVRARALSAVGTLAAWQADIAGARAPLDEAIPLWQELGQPIEEAIAHEALSWALFTTGDEHGAQVAAERALELQLAVGDARLINRARFYVCLALVSQGALDAAEQMSRETLALAELHDDAWAQHFAFHYLGDCALIRGDDHTAEEWYRRSLAAAVAAGDRIESIFELQGIAMSSAVRAPEQSLRLAGAADAELATLGIDISEVRFWMELLGEKLGRALAALGVEAADAARLRGASDGFDQAVARELAATPTAG